MSLFGRFAQYAYRCVFLLCALTLSNASELRPETQNSWDEYLRIAHSGAQQRLHAGARFLWIDEAADRSPRLRAGEILASPLNSSAKGVPSGLIHHWISAAFFPNATVNNTLAVIQDYGRYKDFYSPAVVDSKLLNQADTNFTFSVVVFNKRLLFKSALYSQCRETYFQVDDRRWHGVGYSLRVQEIENYGQSSERTLPPGHGSGYIWRLHCFSRFEERDGGVYLEVEVIALSRDIPASLRWLIDPMVRRVAKSTLLTYLEQTGKAVRSYRDG